MQYIDPDNKDIFDGCAAHFKWAKCFVRKKIGARACKDNCYICNSNIDLVPKVPVKLRELINDDEFLGVILSGTPAELKDREEREMRALTGIETKRRIMLAKDRRTVNISAEDKRDKKRIKTLYGKINKIFNYSSFIAIEPTASYSSYHLAAALARNSCTYCNRNYTSTLEDMDGGKLMRPHFDHWFAKSSRPLLGISFYNLIPSCNICNSSIKGEIEMDIKDYVHPYTDKNQVNDYSFTYEFYKGVDSFRIALKSENADDRALRTAEAFKIDRMYDAHHSELKDLFILKRSYPDSYLEQIKAMLPGNLSDRDAYRIIFGTEAASEEFHKRPLSKFKSDILKELGVIDSKLL